MKRLFQAIQVFDELGNAAVVLERLFFARALVGQLDAQALIQKRQFAKANFQRVVIERYLVEDLWVRLEGNARAGPLGHADFL